MRSTWLATLLLVGLAWGQDIVLKASFPVNWTTWNAGNQVTSTYPIDLNDDSIAEIPISMGNYISFLDITTMTVIDPPENCAIWLTPSWNYPVVMRRQGLAEYICSANPIGYCITDFYSNQSLLCVQTQMNMFYFVDYDSDGLQDLICITGGNFCSVYGVATGSPPISPPQGLDIQTVGNDYVITWDAVPTATAYRIEWSSALDGGVRFTRIGYTPRTTFTHKNQADQERGFYRVLSEDNGTGMVRFVGQCW